MPSSISITRSSKRLSVALWIAQGLLAAIFLFAGGSKLAMPVAELAKLSAPLPGPFMVFISIAETLGGLGLVLPSLLRIRPGLTALAASGLVIIMIGAVVMTLVSPTPALAAIPFTVGILCAFVAYGRWQLVPVRPSSQRVEAQAREVVS